MGDKRYTRGNGLFGSDGVYPHNARRWKRIEVSVPSDGENDSSWDLPSGAVVTGSWLHVKTAEATAGTKTLSWGTDSTAGTNDADGFAVGVSVATTGYKYPGPTITATTEGFSYYSANTRGALLSDYVVGTTAVQGLYSPKDAVGVGGESLTYTPGSTGFAELVADIYIEYLTLTS